MTLDAFETLELVVDDGVATITLNRPDRLNAYTLQMGAEIYTALRALDEDDAVRAIVVTGAGRAFCAGMDLQTGGTTFETDEAWSRVREREEAVRPWNFGTPIIAAINGAAVGIGATLPLQWDIRLAGESARFGFVFTRVGVIPEANSSWILSRLIGLSKAMELLLTGRIIGAQEALDCGLVSRVVPDGQLLEEAQVLAREIAVKTAPVSVAITKRLLWRQLMEVDPRAAKQQEDFLFEWAGKQVDAKEGVTAFLEKRDPQWSLSANDEVAALLPDVPTLAERSS